MESDNDCQKIAAIDGNNKDIIVINHNPCVLSSTTNDDDINCQEFVANITKQPSLSPSTIINNINNQELLNWTVIKTNEHDNHCKRIAMLDNKDSANNRNDQDDDDDDGANDTDEDPDGANDDDDGEEEEEDEDDEEGDEEEEEEDVNHKREQLTQQSHQQQYQHQWNVSSSDNPVVNASSSSPFIPYNHIHSNLNESSIEDNSVFLDNKNQMMRTENSSTIYHEVDDISMSMLRMQFDHHHSNQLLSPLYSSSMINHEQDGSWIISNESYDINLRRQTSKPSTSTDSQPNNVDSSYDSDPESNNSELRRLVLDLVDSGNSTTPDDDEVSGGAISNFNKHKNDTDSINQVNQNNQELSSKLVIQPEQQPTMLIHVLQSLQSIAPKQPQTQQQQVQQTMKNKKPSKNNKKKRKSKSKQQHNQNGFPIQQQQPLESKVMPASSGPIISSGGHIEVDRTTSETLQQEYQEYVTHKMYTANNVDNNETSKMAVNIVFSGPEYDAHVNFGQKLGYTEQQVRQALKTLGLTCQQNELLAELIKITSNMNVLQKRAILPNPPVQQQRHLLQQNHYHQQHLHAPLCSSKSSSVLLSNNNLQQQNGNNLIGANQTGKSIIGKTLSSPVIGGRTVATGLNDASNNNQQQNKRTNSSNNEQQLRTIVIDGSNVAMNHGKQKCFSCRGIELCVEWFKSRGHTDIAIFVPAWRKSKNIDLGLPIKDREILLKLEDAGILFFTPSRNVGGRMLSAYDDRYILNYALKQDAIVVSNDQYRDLVQENNDFKRLVDERLLMYLFVEDEFMPPDDPFGPQGPSLQEFLSKPLSNENIRNMAKFNQICPYEKRCTYGNKCKYFHPPKQLQQQQSNETINKTTESSHNQKLRKLKSLPANQHQHLVHTKTTMATSSCNSLSLWQTNDNPVNKKTLLSRTRSSISIDAGGGGGSLVPSHNSCGSSSMESIMAAAATVASTIRNKPNNQKQSSIVHHRKLERQLTLNPEADPRLSNYLLLTTSSSSQTNPHIAKEKIVQTKSWNVVPINNNPCNKVQQLSNSMATLSTAPSASLLPSPLNSNNNNNSNNQKNTQKHLSPSKMIAMNVGHHQTSPSTFHNKPLMIKSHSLSLTTNGQQSLNTTTTMTDSLINERQAPLFYHQSTPSTNYHQHVGLYRANTTATASSSFGAWPNVDNQINSIARKNPYNGHSHPNVSNPHHHQQTQPNILVDDCQPVESLSSMDDKRKNIYYHLSCIFPLEIVDKAMKLMPDENESFVICNAILKMMDGSSSSSSSTTTTAFPILDIVDKNV